MELQISEQIEAYKQILIAAEYAAQGDSSFFDKFTKPLNIPIKLRKNLLGKSVISTIIQYIISF